MKRRTKWGVRYVRGAGKEYHVARRNIIRRLVERDAQLWVDQQLVFSPAQLVKIFQSAGLTDIHVARQTFCKLPLMNVVSGRKTKESDGCL